MMRLNMDCVRSILLCVEENTGLRRVCFFIDEGMTSSAEYLGNVEPLPDYQTKLKQKYDNDTLIYHVGYSIQAGLIESQDKVGAYRLTIFDLSPSGHELLGNIRDNGNWKKIKETGGKAGAFGLNIVAKIAEGVATAAIKQYLQLP